jgi:hypothetical protein
MFSLTTGFTGIRPILTQPCVMWTLIPINPMSSSFNLHLMPCKMSQYSFCLMPQLEVLLVGCWELGENVKCAMWVVVNHFEKFPTLFAGQLICVNVLPQMSPEWCIYSWRGYFLGVGGKLCILCIGIYKKERKRAFALKICKSLVEILFYFWKGSFQGKVQRYFHKTGALSAFVARWMKKRQILKWPPDEQLGSQSAFMVRPPHLYA